jgi:PAS domain S-box-containing protein
MGTFVHCFLKLDFITSIRSHHDPQKVSSLLHRNIIITTNYLILQLQIIIKVHTVILKWGIKITKILILEDSTSEVNSIKRTLSEEGMKFSSKLVKSKNDFLREMRDFHPDLILADYNLSDFDGLSALEIRNDNSPETPFIFIISTSKEDLAVETLKMGATDYVLRNNFSKLVPEVQRALDEIYDRLESEKREKELIEYQEKLVKIFESTPDAITVTDLNGNITEFNHAALELHGFKSRDELLNKNFLDLIVARDKSKLDKNVIFALFKGSTGFNEYNCLKMDETEVSVEISTSLISDSSGKPVFFVSITRDMTEHKIAEEKLKKSLMEKESLLEEKENLLKEIHHRVNNNMQIITSLLNLQIDQVQEEETKVVLKDSRSRVKSMAMIHEKLYNSNDLSHINFKEYTESLVSDIFYTYGVRMGTIQTILDLEDIETNMETAIPLGLIINELVTNSVKHAFPDCEGKLTLKLNSFEDKMKLTVADSGIGLPTDIDPENSETLGFQLVNSLLNQLEGDLKLDRSNGTKYKIIFKELNYQKRDYNESI